MPGSSSRRWNPRKTAELHELLEHDDENDLEAHSRSRRVRGSQPMDDSGSGCFRGCFVEICGLVSCLSVLQMVWLSTFGASVNLEGVLVNANDSQAPLLP